MTEEQGTASFPLEPALTHNEGGSGGRGHNKKDKKETIPPALETPSQEQRRFVSSWKLLAWILAGGLVLVVVVVVVAVVMSRRKVPDSSSSLSEKEEPQSPSSRSSATNTPPSPTAPSNSNKNKKKNIILIIADDLGIRDLGCYNPNDNTNRFYETPHVDQLAMDADSVLFENAYSAHATCAESRAGLFTGMFPSRLGVVDISRTATFTNLGFGKERVCLRRADEFGRGEQMVPLAAVTIPEALSQHGYRTALIGKWHSGLPSGRGLPHDHGFDIIIGNKTGLTTHFSPYRCRGSMCRPPPSNLSQVPDGTFMADHLTMEAVSLLENEFASASDNASPAPFFLVLSHYAVHTPIESKQGIKQHFSRKRAKLNQTLDVYLTIDGLIERQTQDHPVYAGMLKSLDDSVGTLLQSVRDLGRENDTIIMFTSDNGGKSSNWNWKKAKIGLTSNLPFKAAKEYIGDGGIRVPLIVKAPGLQGSVRVLQPPHGHRTLFQSHGVDYFPTLLELAGLPLQPQDHVDGVSLVPAIQGTTSKRGVPMFWQDPAECFISSTNASQHKCTETSYAVIAEQWKFIKRVYSKQNDNDATLELYNIEADPGERINLAYNESYTQELHEMEQTLQNWQKTWFQTPYFDRLRAIYNNCT